MPIPKKLLLATGAAGVYVLGSYATYTLFKPVQNGEPPCGSRASFDNLANTYDSRVGFEETFMGIKLLRWWLVRQAKGDVLEISAGTGRNLPYYSMSKLRSLVLTDSSKHMLHHASRKSDESSSAVPVSFYVADASSVCDSSRPLGTSSPETPVDWRGQFDFVLDTFGLCSHDDPVKALQEAQKALKPGGKLLLLEHGRSSHNWLNSRLDAGADRHLASWGCHWNLPIDDILRQAGLEVISERRWHFGTTYVIIAAPAKHKAVPASLTQRD